MLPPVSIPHGSGRHFSIGGLLLAFQSRVGASYRFELQPSFSSFETSPDEADLAICLRVEPSLSAPGGRLLWDSRLNWRVYENDEGVVLESYHPPTARRLALASAPKSFGQWDVSFDEASWWHLWGLAAGDTRLRMRLEAPFPLDQLFLVPLLAHRRGFLVHAAGAVVDGKAYVFAGHSGDGKTTLAELLGSEGCELLSDERIAVRQGRSGYLAYGTPWPGEGQIVSSSVYPLGGVFLLRKGSQHRLVAGNPSALAAEILSRSIIPYFWSDEAALILDVVTDLVQSVPVRFLEFSRQPDLPSLVRREL